MLLHKFCWNLEFNFTLLNCIAHCDNNKASVSILKTAKDCDAAKEIRLEELKLREFIRSGKMEIDYMTVPPKKILQIFLLKTLAGLNLVI